MKQIDLVRVFVCYTCTSSDIRDIGVYKMINNWEIIYFLYIISFSLSLQLQQHSQQQVQTGFDSRMYV